MPPALIILRSIVVFVTEIILRNETLRSYAYLYRKHLAIIACALILTFTSVMTKQRLDESERIRKELETQLFNLSQQETTPPVIKPEVLEPPKPPEPPVPRPEPRYNSHSYIIERFKRIH